MQVLGRDKIEKMDQMHMCRFAEYLEEPRHFLTGVTDKDGIEDQIFLYLAQHLPTTNCVGPDVVFGSKACFNVLFSGWKGFRLLAVGIGKALIYWPGI